MIPRPFDEIDRSDLEALVAGAVSERRYLDFKRDLPGDKPDDAREFLADVTSFANAQGGDLIYGMDAKDGVATDLVGLTVKSQDATILGLENTLRSSVDPRLNGVRMEWIPLDAPRGAIIIRIPASFAAPHRVSYRGSSRFYSRNSRGKYPMDTHELRIAFAESERLPRKIREVHDVAVAMARGKDMPTSVLEPAAVVSTIPVGFFREVRDLALTAQNVQFPIGSSGGPIDLIPTLEGLFVSTPITTETGVRSFSLTHWTGRIDTAWEIGGVHLDGSRRVYHERFERNLVEAASSAVRCLQNHGIEGPWVIQTTIVGARGFQFQNRHAPHPCWRDIGPLGDLRVDQANEQTLMPHLKAFWLLFGLQRPNSPGQ